MPATAFPGAAYGWRARIGVLQPSQVSDNNPHEFYLMAPEGVQLAITSMGITVTNQTNYDRAIAGIEEPIRRLLSRHVDVIIQAGVPPIVTHGWGYEDVVKARVAEITPLPFATDTGSCVAALQALGVTRVALLTAFEEEMHDHIAGYLKGAGIAVAAARTIRTSASDEFHSISLAVPYRAARALFQTAPNAQAVWLPGAFMPTAGMVQALEDDLGVPVISSATAMMWQALRLAGAGTREVTGYGRLFQAG